LFGKDDLEWNKDPMILPGASNPSKAFIEHVWKHTERVLCKKNVPKLPGNNTILKIVLVFRQ